VAPPAPLSESAVAALRRYLDGQGRICAAYQVGEAISRGRDAGVVENVILFELDGGEPVGSRRAALFLGVTMDLGAVTEIPALGYELPSRDSLAEARPVATTLWERGAVAGGDQLDFELRWSPYPIDDALKASLAGVAESFDGVSAVYFAEEALVNNGHLVWTRAHLYVVCTDEDAIMQAALREGLRSVLGEQRPALAIGGTLPDEAIASDSTIVFRRVRRPSDEHA
jgi:hypothetical protein